MPISRHEIPRQRPQPLLPAAYPAASILLCGLACLFVGPVLQGGEETEIARTFIKESWEKTFRFHPEHEGTLIGLPKRYTVPSISGSFQEMYYWDTYFTGEGLILDGHVAVAADNVESMLHLVNLYGKMLNGNRTFLNAVPRRLI